MEPPAAADMIAAIFHAVQQPTLPAGDADGQGDQILGGDVADEPPRALAADDRALPRLGNRLWWLL